MYYVPWTLPLQDNVYNTYIFPLNIKLLQDNVYKSYIFPLNVKLRQMYCIPFPPCWIPVYV